MKKLPFELQFFGPAPSTTSIEGEFIYGQSNINAIEVSFELKGELDHYLFEREFKSHDRKDGLWQKSCFEFFIKKWNSSEYIEVNLSPNGEWQSYSFTD